MDAAGDRTQAEAAALRRTSDTHRVIKGRRWRVSDPALDDLTHQLLVDELLHARRSVKTALALADPTAEADARARVHDAKVALGERGPKWWETITPDDAEVRVRAFVRTIGDRLGDIDERQAKTFLRLTT